MRNKLNVRTGDTVEVMAGNSKGSRGRVLKAIPDEGRVVVEGVNMVWKHIKRGRRNNQRGERIETEAPIHASNVMVVCPNRDCERHDRGVRTRSVIGEDGRKRRVCAKCGTEIARDQA